MMKKYPNRMGQENSHHGKLAMHKNLISPTQNPIYFAYEVATAAAQLNQLLHEVWRKSQVNCMDSLGQLGTHPLFLFLSSLL